MFLSEHCSLFLFIFLYWFGLPSVLLHFWLGVRKSNRVMSCWCGYLFVAVAKATKAADVGRWNH